MARSGAQPYVSFSLHINLWNKKGRHMQIIVIKGKRLSKQVGLYPLKFSNCTCNCSIG